MNPSDRRLAAEEEYGAGAWHASSNSSGAVARNSFSGTCHKEAGVHTSPQNVADTCSCMVIGSSKAAEQSKIIRFMSRGRESVRKSI